MELTISRYSAYFRGWCQAFGEHEESYDEASEINWLWAHEQIGLVLADELRKQFYREILRDTSATLRLSRTHVALGDAIHPLKEERDMEGMQALMGLLRRDEPTHLYLTYHLLYPQGTRILTFSKKSPLAIIYKQMRPLKVVLLQ